MQSLNRVLNLPGSVNFDNFIDYDFASIALNSSEALTKNKTLIPENLFLLRDLRI